MTKSNFLDRAKFITIMFCVLLLAGCVCSAPLFPEDQTIAEIQLNASQPKAQEIEFEFRKTGFHAIGFYYKAVGNNWNGPSATLHGILRISDEDGTVDTEQLVDRTMSGLGALYQLDGFQIGRKDLKSKKVLSFVTSEQSVGWQKHYNVEIIVREGDYNPHKRCFF